MPDSYTVNKLGLIEPAAGAYSGTWDQPLFANWQTIDAALGGTTTITLASSNVTLTVPTFPANANPPAVATSAQNLRVLLQGTLAANVFVNLPASVPGMWLIDNQTAVNSFTVTVKTAAGGSTGVAPPRGSLSYIYSDGTNVRYADAGGVTANAPAPAVATDTVNGLVTQGLLAGNCVNLNAAGKIPFQADKYIISASDPNPAQGDQNWLWFKVV